MRTGPMVLQAVFDVDQIRACKYTNTQANCVHERLLVRDVSRDTFIFYLIERAVRVLLLLYAPT